MSSRDRRRRGRRAEVRAAPKRIRGRFRGRPRGDGRLVPEGGDAGDEELHLTRTRLGGALPGDLVEAEARFRGRSGRLEGEVVRVLERADAPLVGVVSGDGAAVDVWGREWSREVVIPGGARRGARPGEFVALRVTGSPAVGGRPVTGEVVRVFGGGDEPEAELAAALFRFGLRDEFPPEAAAQAEEAPVGVSEGDRAGREDLRGRLIVTMDPKEARDHDDAVEAAEGPGGGFEIGVHIADVGRYVPAGSPVDEEAARRGTSAYFPERAVPMLPEALSSGICSLRAGVDRLAVSARLTVGGDGTLREARFFRSVIRSAAGLDYGEGAAMLAGAEPGPLGEAVRVMGRAASLLAAARRRRGAVDLDLPEPAVETDARGNLVRVGRAERTEAHRLVEEFMLLANQAVAERLGEAGLPALFRAHAAPPPDRAARFEDLLTAFGERLAPAGAALRPAHFARLLERIANRREAPFLRRRMLRALALARYAPKNEGHFALALPDYLHFTSPIRRYPDLLAHRALAAHFDGVDSGLPDGETIAELAESCSRTERAAEAAERALLERRITRYLAARLGDAFPARVSALGRFGLEAELDEVPVTGTVPMETLLDDRYRFHRQTHSLRGRATGRSFRLGDPLEVQLVRADRRSGELEFVLAG